MAVANGIFAVLFVALLLYILKDGRAREQKYQETIKR
ncbi:MAG: bacteriocin, partial [Clostridiales bacterium]|nr:bacteriocin [Clostridiales bacterium]